MTDLTSLSYGAYAIVFVAGFSGIMFGLMSAVEQTYRKLAPRPVERARHGDQPVRSELR